MQKLLAAIPEISLLSIGCFERFDENDRARVLPVCIHGDKGRTYLKQPILCVSWESAFGLPKWA